jgi:hypothetical protein
LMNRSFLSLAALLALSTIVTAPSLSQTVTAPPDAFNFQARIAAPSGNPVLDGNYNLRFRFYDAPTGGNVLHEYNAFNVPVKNGVAAITISGFTADKFHGNTWLAISVNGGADLAPRTQIVSVPYALKSTLALTVPDGSITGAKLAAGTVTTDKLAANVFNGTAWQLSGNSGVTSGFLGTTDNQPLELRANNRRMMRYVAAEFNGVRSPNILGGSDINTLGVNIVGATVAGGGYDSILSDDRPNSVLADFGTVSGGYDNTASNFASTIGGGANNATNGRYAVIAGGLTNTASQNFAAVGGGNFNIASGLYSVVPGGYNNSATGTTSFAAGSQARANHSGTFVWNSSSGAFASTGANQFLVSAPGGVGIGTNTPANSLHIKGVPNLLALEGTDHVFMEFFPRGYGAGRKAYIGFPSANSHDFVIANQDSGVLRLIGTVVNDSDIRYKRNIADLADPLDAILGLHGVSYQWKQGLAGVPDTDRTQIGFLAQEVEKVLPYLVHTNDKGYKSVNYIGVVPVLVEAVKTQNRRMETLSKENAELKAKNTALEARLDAVERALAELADKKR